ncbi:MAG: hypothetical protein L6R41_005934 [Letrouitia leprolyta]|nr:MAG: hypothetical protein L6R41_005934 [Letrouitia leprolyta]
MPPHRQQQRKKYRSLTPSLNLQNLRLKSQTPAPSTTMPTKKKATKTTSHTSTQTNTTVYIVSIFCGYRSGPTHEPKFRVDTTGVFDTVEKANDFAHQWLKEQWPLYFEGEGWEEVVREDGGVEVECLTGEEDGNCHLKVQGWVVG